MKYFKLSATHLSKLALTMGLLLALSIPASAHAFLDHALPKVGSTVDGSPTEVRVWYTEELEPAFSKMHVMDASGKIVSKAAAHVDPANPSVLVVALPKLPPGTYMVMWSVVAKDTHHTTGNFSFTVKG